MILMFNPSIFALVLSTVNAASARRRSGGGEGDKVVAADDSFYGRENEAFEKTTAQRRAEKIFPLNNNANKDSRPIIGSGGVNPDVGILLQGERLRRLQSGAHSCDINHRRILQSTNNTTTTDTIADDVDYAVCGTMCKPAVCDCIYNIWCDCGVECASEIDAVCNGVTDANGTEWTIQGCITDYPQYPGYQEYFINVFCPFAKCIVDGGTFGSCWCQGYKTHCEKFGDERIYVVRLLHCLCYFYLVKDQTNHLVVSR